MTGRQAPARVDLYFEDFLGGMFDLTPEERGDYFTVCCLLWKHKGRLPDDDRVIARWCNTSIRAWRAAKARLVELGKLVVEDGLVRQPRAEHEWSAAVERLQAAQEKGRKGAEKRRENAPSSDDNGAKNRPEKSAKPLNGHETTSSPARSSGFSHHHHHQQESLTSDVESVTVVVSDARAGARRGAPAGAEEEGGEWSAQQLLPDKIKRLAFRYEMGCEGKRASEAESDVREWACAIGAGPLVPILTSALRPLVQRPNAYVNEAVQGFLERRERARAEGAARAQPSDPIIAGTRSSLAREAIHSDDDDADHFTAALRLAHPAAGHPRAARQA